MIRETAPTIERTKGGAAGKARPTAETGPSVPANAARILGSHMMSASAIDLRGIHVSAVGEWLHQLTIPSLPVNADHVVEFANRAFGHSFQHHESPVGKPFPSLFTDSALAHECRKLLQKTFSRGTPGVIDRKIELRGLTIRGKIHCRAVFLRNNQMALIQIEKLSRPRDPSSKEYYRKLVESVEGGVAEFSLDWPLPRDTDVDKLLDAVLDAKLVDGNRDFAGTPYHRSGIDRLLQHCWSWTQTSRQLRPAVSL